MSNQQYYGNAPSGPPQGRPQGHQPIPNEWQAQHHEFDNPSPQPQYQQFQSPPPQQQHFQNPPPQQFQAHPPQDHNPFHSAPPQQHQFQNAPPGPHAQHHPPGHPAGFHPPHRTDSESLLPTGQERSEQMETMQNYEMSRPQSYDDRAQEELQRQFPNMDSSLIAAIWNDNKDMGAAREMLQHLSDS